MTSSATKKTMLVDAFEVALVDIRSVDPEMLQALSVSVGWPQRDQDWAFLCTVGHGIAAVDKIGRVVGTAMWFPYSEQFATIGMVLTVPRLQSQGAGRWLMDFVLQELGDRALGLNCTAEALQLYISLGFTIRQQMFQRQGIAATPPALAVPEGVSVRPLKLQDIDQIFNLDSRAFGSDRSKILSRLVDVSGGQVLECDGAIRAYSLCRAFGRGAIIGPVVADTDEHAIAVTRPFIADHAGSFLRVDTRQKSGLFPQFLELSGLSVHDTLNTMWRGHPWPTALEGEAVNKPIAYGLASQTLS